MSSFILSYLQILKKFYSFEISDSKEGTVEQDDDPRILGSLSYQNCKAFDDSDSRYLVTLPASLSLFKPASKCQNLRGVFKWPK